MRKNWDPRNSQEIKICDLRNIHGKKIWTDKLPTREKSGPTKYPREKILEPRNTLKKKFWSYEIQKNNMGQRNTLEKKFWSYEQIFVG